MAQGVLGDADAVHRIEANRQAALAKRASKRAAAVTSIPLGIIDEKENENYCCLVVEIVSENGMFIASYVIREFPMKPQI